MIRRSGRWPLLAAAPALFLVLVGCGTSGADDQEPSSADASGTSSASPSATGSGPDGSSSQSPSQPPSQPPSQQGPSAMPTPGKNAGGGTSDAPSGAVEPGDPGTPTPGIEASLLTPERLPGLNENTTWTEDKTGPLGDDPIGDCGRATLADLGAQQSAVRTFHARGGLSAAQAVAQFTDDAAARQAQRTLESWRADCAEQLDAGVEKVGPLSTVSTQRGTASSYLLQFGPRGAMVHNFHGVGITRVGAKVSVISIETKGQDYNYPAGQEPASRAAAAAARNM